MLNSTVFKKIAFLYIMLIASNAALFAKWIDQTDRGGTVTASSQIHERESKEMAFDNSTESKWLTGGTATGWIQFQFPADKQYTITKYSISSANDAPERDPRNWTLSGSNDQENWFVVDSQIDQSWSARFLRREFSCSSPGSYNYYRLDITLNNGSGDLTGFSEMELMEYVYMTDNPSPVNLSDNIKYENIVLSWDGPSELANPEYKLYISDDLSLVQHADPLTLAAQQNENYYTFSLLESFTTYYWRVDVVDGGTDGFIWQFKTEQPDIDCLGIASDIDSNCSVDISDLEIIALQWLLQSCPSGPCGDIDGSLTVDLVDWAAVSKDWSAIGENIVIHEIMADNETTLLDDFGEYSDWIEIRNLGDTAVDLEGWYLANDKDSLTQWQFPSVVIAPNQYLIVFASDRDIKDDIEHLHLNFKLSKGGQYLALVRPDMTLAHEFSPKYPELGNDQSYGLTLLPGEDNFVTSLLAEPTPGEFNASAEVWHKPEFSAASGIYQDAFSLELSVDGLDFDIRYTLDGSVPDRTSQLYTGPLAIDGTTCIRAAAFKDKYLPGKAQTRTYIFPDDIVLQPELPVDYPVLWKTTAADYEMDPDIVDDPVYGPLLEDSLLSLPSLSIVTDIDNLFDFNTGIYSNPLQEGVAWEREAFVELITPDNSESFQINCGLRIQGGAFRGFNLARKKSFRLLFKRQYGSGKLNFPLFDYDPDAVESFDTITLRAGANDGYSWDAAYGTEQYIRDEFGRSVLRDSGNAGSHGRFVHLYLNGLYWGLYNAVERPDNAFSASYNGGDKDQWDALNSGDVSEGIKDAWNDLMSKCQVGISTMDAYQELQGNNPDGSDNPAYPNLIDMANYIDYIIINMWGGNGDWPWRNYWVGRKHTDDSEGFQFYCWDYEGTMASPFANYNKVTADFNSGVGVPHHNLKDFSEYRMLFADRVHRMFFNDGTLTKDINIQRYSQLADQVQLAIVAESARWGDQHHYPPLGLEQWLTKRDDILNNYLPSRSDIVLGQFIAAGYYPELEAPVFNINGANNNGGYVETGDEFSITGIYSSSSEVVLIDYGHPVSYCIPSDNSRGLSWVEESYEIDDSWVESASGLGVGYEINSGYENLIGTDIESQIYNKETSVFCRMAFDIDSDDPVDSVMLSMKYDDGFIAYLNGVEVARSGNINSDIPGQATADNHEADTYYEAFDITEYKSLLHSGSNVLAIHGINYSVGSSDLIVLPLLTIEYNLPEYAVPILYTTDGSDPRLVGGGINPLASLYLGTQSLSESVSIKARAYQQGQWSAINEAFYAVGDVAQNLRITEIMYNPATDPNSEFIELLNIGTESINLKHVRFVKGIDFEFSSVEIAPDHRVVIVRDYDAFLGLYTDFDGIIAGEFDGSLDNGGERIKLIDALGTEILDFEYKDSWYDITDGEGFSLIIKDPAADIVLWDEKDGWRPGEVIGGTPAQPDSGLIPAEGSIVINEILAHSNYQEYDWIELYNTTGLPINIGGWYLSDNNDDEAKRKKYQIAEGTIVPAYGYKVFYENVHFGNVSDPGCNIPFQFSENGETAYLQSGRNGVLTGYYIEEEFGASQKDIAFGRYQKSTGKYNFVPMADNTPEYDNTYPMIGPVIITEIMYYPEGNSDAEYIELQNVSDSDVVLYDFETDTPWRFIDDDEDMGIEYYFPTHNPVTIEAGEKILLIKDLSAFTREFGLPAEGIQYFQWIDGSLSNGGEKPEIQMPGDIDPQQNRYYIRIDRISYDDKAPWPTNPDGHGESLHRISHSSYGNDPVNWQSLSPTPGL